MESHCAWSEKAGLEMPLAIDQDAKVAAMYGAVKPAGGIARTVVIVDRHGNVAYAQQGLPETEALLLALHQINAAYEPRAGAGG